MSETEAVKETRRWRREVYEQTLNLTAPERREREDELLRGASEAGVEFEEVIETDTEATHMRPSSGMGGSGGSNRR